MSLNASLLLDESARSTPDASCLIDGSRVITYSQLQDRSKVVAAGLLRLGARRGDRVIIQLPNGVEFVETYFAVLRAGMVAVPINPSLKAPEIAHLLSDSGAAVYITHISCVDDAAKALEDRNLTVVVLGGAAVTGETAGEMLGYDELSRGGVDAAHQPTGADDTAVLIYTSGTTGKPKGAQISHLALVMSAMATSQIGEISSADVGLGALPLFHVYGLSTVLNTFVCVGASLVLTQKFVTDDICALVRDHGITVLHGVPTMFISLLGAPHETDGLTNLRLAVSGGAPLPAEVIEAFEQMFPHAVLLEGYGMSETASALTFNRSREDRRMLSVGRPLWGVDVNIVDDDGRVIPNGADHIGEITVSGPVVTAGYHGNPDATREALRHDRLHTGDIGYIDHDGYLFIVDRKKDLVIRGGYNVYPREVEEVLYTHPAVAEAAVIGVAHTRLGEEVHAVVSLRRAQEATEAELIEHCRERLAHYKYPRSVQILATLPKGPSGKILKTKLR